MIFLTNPWKKIKKDFLKKQKKIIGKLDIIKKIIIIEIQFYNIKL